MKATITGLDKLQTKLNKVAAVKIESGLLKGALRVERDAKILVPVDTGLLRSSITHSVEGNTAIVGTSIEYAAKVELGINQRRQPYLTPALNINREAINKDIQAELNKELEKVAK